MNLSNFSTIVRAGVEEMNNLDRASIEVRSAVVMGERFLASLAQVTQADVGPAQQEKTIEVPVVEEPEVEEFQETFPNTEFEPILLDDDQNPIEEKVSEDAGKNIDVDFEEVPSGPGNDGVGQDKEQE